MIRIHSVALGAVLVVLGACRGESTQSRRTTPPAEPRCGDGVLDPGEECDGSELGEATCVSLGFEGGTLSCDATCKHATVACVKRCGNGTIDPGETCDGTLGLGGCDAWGYPACSSQCAADSSHCVSQPFSAAPTLSVPNGGPAIIDDVAPAGQGDLIMAVPSFLRLVTYQYSDQQGFVESRKLSFQRVPKQPASGDFDGDGEVDLAAINADGTIDRYVYQPATNSFRAQTIHASDGGSFCPAASWLGAADIDEGEETDLAALGCSSGSPPRASAILVFGATHAPMISQPGIQAAALGDADGDGLTDLLFVVEGAMELRVLRSIPLGFSAAPSLTLPFTPSAIAAGDLDGDGDLDLAAVTTGAIKVLENTGASFAERASFSAAAPVGLMVKDLDLDGRVDLSWLQGDRVQLRRNAGGFQFQTYDAPTGAGTALSLAAGDVDGDGDPDLAATYAQSGEATVTYVLLNEVR